MSPEDQDAVAGRVLRELRDAEIKLAALMAEADKIGGVMAEISDTLRHNPQNLMFASQSININYVREGSPLYQPSVVPTFDKLATLTNDVRNTMQTIDRLRNHASKLGFSPK